MINNPIPSAAAVQPRGMAFINGERARGLDSFEVDNNSFFQADSFRLTLILSAQAPDRGFDFWASQTSLQVELLAGFPPNADSFDRSGLTSWLTGNVDDIEIDPLADTITMTGRDLTALLIDTKRSIAFREMKSSAIAAQIADELGLQKNIAETKTFAGTFAQVFKQTVNDRATYWDVLTKLAQIEQFSLWVSGNTLNFQPARKAADVYVLRYQPATDTVGSPQANAVRMRFMRNLSVSRGVKVTVRSFNQKTGHQVSATATRARVRNQTTARAGATGLPPAEYFFVYPNMTADQAQAKANALAQEISQHEVNIEAELPGDQLLTAQTPVQMLGTGTKFDQIYYPASVQRRYSLDEGYRITLRARNFSPETVLS